jgi:hypothetical protein
MNSRPTGSAMVRAIMVSISRNAAASDRPCGERNPRSRRARTTNFDRVHIVLALLLRGKLASVDAKFFSIRVGVLRDCRIPLPV